MKKNLNNIDAWYTYKKLLYVNNNALFFDKQILLNNDYEICWFSRYLDENRMKKIELEHWDILSRAKSIARKQSDYWAYIIWMSYLIIERDENLAENFLSVIRKFWNDSYWMIKHLYSIFCLIDSHFRLGQLDYNKEDNVVLENSNWFLDLIFSICTDLINKLASCSNLDEFQQVFMELKRKSSDTILNWALFYDLIKRSDALPSIEDISNSTRFTGNVFNWWWIVRSNDISWMQDPSNYLHPDIFSVSDYDDLVKLMIDTNSNPEIKHITNCSINSFLDDIVNQDAIFLIIREKETKKLIWFAKIKKDENNLDEYYFWTQYVVRDYRKYFWLWLYLQNYLSNFLCMWKKLMH